MKKKGIDPILAAVLAKKMKSITEEVNASLLRNTRSPILSEANDFITALYDAQGQIWEQSEAIPIIAFSLQPVCAYLVQRFEGDLYPGDVLIHNDVFSQGNQNPDVAILKPIFYRDELLAFMGVKGHVADIGGNVAGGYNPLAREIWQEALRIPGVKLYERGELRRDVWELIFANLRYKVVEDDIRAFIGGCLVGEKRFLEVVERYGPETVKSHMDYVLDSTEKMVRDEIRKIPDGTYTGESYLRYDGIIPGKIYKFQVTVTVEGDQLTLDFTGTDPQTPGAVNAPESCTKCSLMTAFLMLIRPDVLHNQGLLRPIRFIIPKGSLLNAEFPAATVMGNHISDQMLEAVFRALAPALPERVVAGWSRHLFPMMTGIDPRFNEPYAEIGFFSMKGGGGGTYGCDGYDHIGLHASGGGVYAQDPEMHEVQAPHLIQHFELWPDSAGSGEWRGGYGTHSVFKMYGQKVQVVTIGHGLAREGDEEAYGLYGGKGGKLNDFLVHFPDGNAYCPASKEIMTSLEGAIIEQYAAGGGGYGDPHRRPVEKVLGEVRDELLSIQKAREDYGVVIDPQTLEVNYEETRKIRGRINRPGYPRALPTPKGGK